MGTYIINTIGFISTYYTYIFHKLIINVLKSSNRFNVLVFPKVKQSSSIDGAFSLAVRANLTTGPISLNLRDISAQTCLISMLICSLSENLFASILFDTLLNIFFEVENLRFRKILVGKWFAKN